MVRNNSPDMSEARELLLQNKQDLNALKSSPESRVMESFVSQKAEGNPVEPVWSGAQDRKLKL